MVTNELVTLQHACGWKGLPLLSKNQNGVGAYCRQCLSWIKWVPQTTPWLQLYEEQQAIGSGITNNTQPIPEDSPWFEPLVNMATECRQIAEEHGWHTEPRSTLERAMLVVTECAELSEAARHGTLQSPSDHIPDHTQAAEEWADILVRVFDHSADDGVTAGDLARAFIAKVEFNRSRPYRHGGKTF